MPQLHFVTYSLIVLVAILLSACATTTSVESERDGTESVATGESLLSTPADEASDPLSDLMFEVLTG